jgi:hypothetical protein
MTSLSSTQIRHKNRGVASVTPFSTVKKLHSNDSQHKQEGNVVKIMASRMVDSFGARYLLIAIKFIRGLQVLLGKSNDCIL